MVEKLIYFFLSGNLKFDLTREEIDELTWNNQERFLKLTVHNNLCKNFPLSSEFCRLFFKKLLWYLEPFQEIHDSLYEFVCTIMKKKCVKELFCYRHYIFKGDLNNVISIKETNNIVMNGTTGMKTWEAAIMLSDWILCNKDLFHGKDVLELGAGVGFTGISIGKHCTTKTITITDCHIDVLKLLEENIAINFPELQKDGTSISTCFSNEKKHISVKKLDWNCIEDLDDIQNPDVIIGADIVYDPLILKPLCTVINTFFKRNPLTEVYIASIIRNEDTFTKFLDHLGKINVTVEKYMPTTCNLNWDQEVQRCLIKIKKML